VLVLCEPLFYFGSLFIWPLYCLSFGFCVAHLVSPTLLEHVPRTCTLQTGLAYLHPLQVDGTQYRKQKQKHCPNSTMDSEV